MTTINTNNMTNLPVIMTADDFIPFDKLPIQMIASKKYLEPKSVTIYGKTYPSVGYDYWQYAVDFDTFKRFAPDFSKKVINLFGEETVARNLEGITMHNLTSTQNVPVDHLDIMVKATNGILLGGLQTITVTKQKGEWTREDEVTGVRMIIPSHYSGGYQASMMRGCLQEKYPWLKNFDCNFYGYDGDNYEFYVDVTPEEEKNAKDKKRPNQTLYVSLKAILEQNPQIIKDRMENYFTWFYRGKEELYNRAMCALDTPMGKKFLECVAGNTADIPNVEKAHEIQVRGCTYNYLVVFTKFNHSSVKNFDSLEKAIYSLKTKMNSLLEDYGSDDIEFATDWPTATVKFIKNGLYELQLVRIVTKDNNK